MNAPLTRAADGLPRRAFTNAEIARMVEAGVIDPDESFELIKGEIVPMSPELNPHVRARTRLLFAVRDVAPASVFVTTEASLYLADDIEFKPDVIAFPDAIASHDVRGPDVLLAAEIASTTRNRDLHLKAPLYAAHGVRELWVFDLDARITHVMREPSGEGYRSVQELKPRSRANALLLPGLAVALADLDLVP
jgi:Uma2 family endonuclease